MQTMELTILDWIQTHLRCGFLDAVLPVISWTCNHGEIWILLALVLLASKKYRWVGISMGCALLLDLICCNLILKPLVGRIRPFSVNAGVELLIAPPTDASFPSGHTASSFAAAVALWRSSGSLWAGLSAQSLAAVIAFSRLYLYVHWPSDVLGGALLGTALGCLAPRLALALQTKLSAHRGKPHDGE